MSASKNKTPDPIATGSETPAVNQPHFMKRVVNHAIAVADSRPVFWIYLIILPITLLALYPAKFEDYDIWFHLTYGREYVQNLSWTLDHSQFSWTPAHNEWTYVTWIGSGLLFLTHAAAGVTGLCLLQWLVFIGMLSCLILYARASGFRINVTMLTALVLIMSTIRILSVYIKPEMFTSLFFFAATVIYFHGKQSEKRNFFWVYPLLFLVWVNTHGGVIVGMGFLGMILGLETVARLFFPGQAMPWPRYKRLALFACLAVLATLINPHGIFYHLQVFGKWIFGTSEVMVYHQQVAAYEGFWAHLTFANKRVYWIISGWSLVIMAASFVVLAADHLLRKKTLPLAILVINVFFFLFSMSLARAIIFYPPIWFCSMIYLLRQRGAFNLPRLAAPVALLAFMALNAVAFLTLLVVEAQQSWFGAGMEEYIPVKEVQFIKDNHLPGPILNDYLIGGYMIWTMYPDYKVFIDPRFAPYDKSLLDDYFNMQERYMSRKAGPEILRDKYEFNIALISMNALALTEWLVNSPQWALVYFDKTAVVLMHRSVLHTLSPEARAMDVGPQRFRDLDNPVILENLFNFYQNFGIGMAADIRDTYERNVSNLYYYKKNRMDFMNEVLKKMKTRPARRE